MKIVGDNALNKLLTLIKNKLDNYFLISGGKITGDTEIESGKSLQLNTLKAPTTSGGPTYGVGGSGKVLKSNGTTVYWGDDNNTTYSVATTSANGLISKEDKVKLDGIAANATKVSYTASATSGNKVGEITINGTKTDMYSPTQTSVSGNAGTATKWATARIINGMKVQGDANRVNYGTCSTAAATAAKMVDCAGFELITGSEITVKFTVTNTATQPTLNVNGTGAKAIYYRGDIIPPSYLANGRVYTFRYDGTNYELVGDINTDTNTDTKVTQNLVNDNASYPLLLTPKGQSANATTTACFDSGVTLNPSTKTINANISGNAATATSANSATKATQDSDGKQINTTYVAKTDVNEYSAADIEALWNNVFAG